MATKNPYGKSRPTTNPYFTITREGWTWHVLKLYKSPAATLGDPFARAFCAVSSPFTFGGFDMGDTYVHEIPGLTAILQKEVSNQ